jgi:hypothetical protein
VRRWTAEQDAVLRALYGTMSAADVAWELNRRFETERGEDAVRQRAAKLAIPADERSWGAHGLARILGVAPGSLCEWIDRRDLFAFTTSREGARYGKWRVPREEAARFVRDNWRRFDQEAIRDPMLRAAYLEGSRMVRALSVTEALRRLGTTRRKLTVLLESGRVPGASRVAGVRGGNRGAWAWRIPDRALGVVRPLLTAPEGEGDDLSERKAR